MLINKQFNGYSNQVPQTGLMGSEQALMGGANQARGDINQSTAAIMQLLGGAESNLNSFQSMAGPGVAAARQQGALSGAMGQRQQQQAYDQFMASPGQQFLQDRGEQSLLRNSAAIGGLGGGNVRKELMNYGQGMAAQDFGNQFNRLGAVADRGLSAANMGAGYLNSLAGQGVGALSNAGGNLANVAMQTGSDLSSGRTRAGEAIASANLGTTSALSSLMNQQGTGAASMLGDGAANIANLLSGAGANAGQGNEQLAALLGNLAVSQGTQVASLPSSAQFLNSTGVVDDLAALTSGVGTAMGG